MIPVLSVHLMRLIDKNTIQNELAVGYSFMLKAGACIYEEVKRLLPDKNQGEIAVVCGKGNNGGDGFVAARLLLEDGFRVMCFGLCPGEQCKGEAKLAFDQYLAQMGNYLLLDDISDLGNLSKYSLIIDGLLGTGLQGSPHGIYAETIDAINQSGVRVLSIDTPSGLDNDSAIPSLSCVKAHTTVALGFPKIGAFFHPGKASVGSYCIKDLGYPEKIVSASMPSLFLPTRDSLQLLLPERKPWGSKFDHGVVTMVCGSPAMTGSAALASNAAMRTGCGLVNLAAPHSIISALSTQLQEIVLHGFDETANGSLALGALPKIIHLSKKSQAICIGPGLSHEEETCGLVRELVRSIKCPMILDADGINAFKGRASELKNKKSPLIITPHKGEWARLFGLMPKAPLDIVSLLKKTAQEYDLTILYKGSPTLVASAEGKVYVLPFGNSGMATAGSGDVLSGIIASLIAQGCTAVNSAILGAYLHAEAGNAARNEFNEYSMVAHDMVNNIFKAINTLTA